ncbi:YhcN/YlaJ family sporulation lipoprotein [Paenibacillus sp. Soil522]|uniref:YhcN/YlaJ family sporulation lipoprotein n=1 Tax=Paenibacillus sp. Soil522 TaxID=1736388 RepID=UPI0006FDC048|nr:YhcN/YlaJ family sporulation lipoprotein [Paenibacillus sp. Soil522]KRE47089.1 hypothetical protein ASG81_09455 [Paenibacillus sp. Soil522]
MSKNKMAVKIVTVVTTSLFLVITGCTNIPNREVRQQTVRDNNREPQALVDRNLDNRGPRALRDENNVDNRGPRALRDENNVDNRIEVADKAAEKITNVKGVDQANVLITRRNAYVAAALDSNQNQLTKQIEDQIAQQVRAVDPDIQNVYVSTNPEFIDRINGYVNDVGQGRPVAGFVEQFNEMVERIFPNAR